MVLLRCARIVHIYYSTWVRKKMPPEEAGGYEKGLLDGIWNEWGRPAEKLASKKREALILAKVFLRVHHWLLITNIIITSLSGKWNASRLSLHWACRSARRIKKVPQWVGTHCGKKKEGYVGIQIGLGGPAEGGNHEWKKRFHLTFRLFCGSAIDIGLAIIIIAFF